MKLIDRLKELYPSGMVLGKARAIVSQYGLIVEWINPDMTISRERLEEDEEVSIIRTFDDSIKVMVGNYYIPVVLSSELFKGIKYKKYNHDKR